MSVIDKIKWIVLPSLFAIGIGILEIQHPHALAGFDDNHTGRGVAGLILLLFELFLVTTWGTIGGILAISLGTLAIVMCFLPSKQPEVQTSTVEASRKEQAKTQSSTNSTPKSDQDLHNSSLSVFAFNTSRAYIQHKIRNRLRNRRMK